MYPTTSESHAVSTGTFSVSLISFAGAFAVRAITGVSVAAELHPQRYAFWAARCIWALPSRCSVRPGARQAQARLEALEVRSFEVNHTFGLRQMDFHDGSRRVLEKNGRWIKPQLLGVLDDHSRLCCHAQWYRSENTEALVHGFSQAIVKRGLPRSLMSDNDSAMISSEFTQGLHTLGIVHERTLPRSANQYGKQETLWATLEGRLMAMISDAEDLTLEHLNLYTQLWVEQDYHQNRHSELGSTPLRRFLDAPSLRRDAPDSNTLRSAFCEHVTRRQRRSNGTAVPDSRKPTPFNRPTANKHTLEQRHYPASTD